MPAESKGPNDLLTNEPAEGLLAATALGRQRCHTRPVSVRLSVDRDHVRSLGLDKHQ
jgi:hypothetical protein